MVLQQSQVVGACDECRAPFDPVHGGVCPQCKRLLCPAHMYGSVWRRLQAMAGGRPRCVSCREGREPIRRKPR